MEAGERWMLNDVAGKPQYAWNSRDHRFRMVYDRLRRPTDSFLKEGAGAEILVGRSVYGETQPNPETHNLRGKVAQVFDQAGVVTSDDYDFKGNLLRGQRQLAQEYKTALDWSAAVPLEADIYTSRTRYDALNRPTELTAPDNSVIRPGYNEANLLERVEANLRGAQQNGQPVWTPFVTDIDYDAKGQRQLIEHGNGSNTTYDYDPKTFRLTHLKTTRAADNAALQDLSYTYDPAGNITHIRDDAQQTIYFNGQVVLPQCDYAYDAIYRLINATGREHIGQLAQPQTTWNDEFRVNLPQPGDGPAVRNYTEHYLYDTVGNFEKFIHRAANGNWTRAYAYNEASLIEAANKSNSLSSTTVGQSTESYTYDEHGNMLKMPHLPQMDWDFKDELHQVDLGGGGTAYYVYDAAGQRVRKVWEKSANLIEERIYLGGFEIYRRRQGAERLERETLHIMDDKQRIALVETRTLDTAGNDPTPAQLIRYQFGNHLGSSSLELDDQAQIISYEEYIPYGSTSYQAVRSQTETPKRYRYTGKERDEESGLYYHGARYFAPWLGRWTRPDPEDLVDGANLFVYSMNNPVRFFDPSGRETEESKKDARKSRSHVIILGEEIPGRGEEVKGNADKWLQKLLNTSTVERFSERVSPNDRLLIALSPKITKRERKEIDKIVKTFQATFTDSNSGKPTVDVTVKTVKPEKLAKEVNALDNIETVIFMGHGSSTPKYVDWSSFPKPTEFDARKFSSDCVALWASCNLDVYAEKFTKHTGVTSLGVEGTTWFGKETITAGSLDSSDAGTSKLWRFDLVKGEVQKSGPYSINSWGIPILQPRDPSLGRDPFEPSWPDVYELAPKKQKKPQKSNRVAPLPAAPAR